MKNNVLMLVCGLKMFAIFSPIASLWAVVEWKVGPGEKFATIQSAVDAVPNVLAEPYVIRIAPGSYPESVRISGKKTSLDNTLCLTALDEKKFPIIDGEGVRSNSLVLASQEFVVLERLHFKGAVSYGNLFLDRSHRNRVSRCVISGSRNFDGLNLSGSTLNVIENNVFYRNKRSGVYLGNSSANNVFRFNLFAGNGAGLSASEKFSSAPVLNNWNLYFENKNASVSGATPDIAMLQSDPRFRSTEKDREDFGLEADSPCPRWGPFGEATEKSPEAVGSLSYAKGPGQKGFAFIPLPKGSLRSLQDDKAGDLMGGWTDQGDYDLRHAPLGIQTFQGVPFSLPESPGTPGVMVLKGSYTKSFPPTSGKIPVHLSADKLSFLHACAWPGTDVVFRYVVRYEDGKSFEIPILRRKNVDDWWNPSDLPGTPVAWKKAHPKHPEATLGFFLFTWENPYPFVPIETIEVVSESDSTPIVLAITAHEPPKGFSFRAYLSASRSELKAGETLALALDASGKGSEKISSQVQIFDEQKNKVYQSEPKITELSEGATVRQEISWTAPLRASRENYKIAGSLVKEGRTLSESILFLPVNGTESSETPRLESKVTANKSLGEGNILYGVELQPWKAIHFSKRLKGVKPPLMEPNTFSQVQIAGANVGHLVCWWSYIEPKPGEYDFSSIDYGIEQCRKAGIPASISVWMGDHGVPAFLYEEDMRDQFGRPLLGDRGTHQGYGHHPSIWGPKSREAFTNMVAAVCRRYLADPSVMAWNFAYQHIEVPIHDRPSATNIYYDYSPWAQAAFRKYLQEVRGFSLEQLNRRYGTTWKSWENVEQPVPVAELDVSLRFSDFQDFRVYSIRECYLLSFRTVRSVDPSGLKQLYAFNPSFTEDLCVKYKAVVDYTGSEGVGSRTGMLSLRLYPGSPSLMVEPTTIPPGLYEIGSGFFNALSAQARAYYWVGTEVLGFDAATPSARLFKKYRDAWMELSSAERAMPDLAVHWSGDTVLADDKILLPGVKRFMPGGNYFSLLEHLNSHQYDYQPVADRFFVQGGGAALASFKLIIDNDGRVMREAYMRELIRQATAGSTLLLEPMSGFYCRENPVVEQSLGARLGWGSVLAKWESAEGDSTIRSVGKNDPYFSGASLRFENRYPIERIKLGNLVLDEQGKPFARIVQYGKGKIVLTAGTLDWTYRDSVLFLDRLAELSGYQKPATASPQIRVCRLSKGTTEYILVFNEQGNRFVETEIRVPSIPAKIFSVRNVTDGLSFVGEVAGEKFRSGYPISLSPYEFRAYRLDQR